MEGQKGLKPVLPRVQDEEGLDDILLPGLELEFGVEDLSEIEDRLSGRHQFSIFNLFRHHFISSIYHSHICFFCSGVCPCIASSTMSPMTLRTARARSGSIEDRQDELVELETHRDFQLSNGREEG